MVPNGIEYLMSTAYAEKFELLQATDFGIDLRKVTSVTDPQERRPLVAPRARDLLDQPRPSYEELKAWVEDSGEGRWTVNEAIAHAVPVPTIAASLFARFSSRQENSIALRVHSALRNQFGECAVKKAWGAMRKIRADRGLAEDRTIDPCAVVIFQGLEETSRSGSKSRRSTAWR